MSATATRISIVKRFMTLNVPLNTNVAAVYRGNRVGAIPLTYSCGPMGTVANMTSLGKVQEDRPGVDNVGGTSYPVPILLDEPMEVEYLANDSDSPIVLATHFMRIAYYKDDHTWTLTVGTNAKGGLIVDVDAKLGVGVWVKPILSRIADASLIS